MATQFSHRGAALLLLILTILCTGHSARAQALKGSGSTFIAPLMSHWIDAYQKANPQVTISYAAVGSGQGITDYRGGNVDFGATDAPLSKSELEKLPQTTLQAPVAAGAVVVAYNVPGISTGLRLSGDVLAGIFLGKITTWNDSHIAQDNPDLKLPALPITVAHRSDGSGTTYIFTKYLSAISPEWRSAIGAGKIVNWPAGQGGAGNPGVAALVKRVPGAIGYIELTFAHQTALPFSAIKNRSGKFVTASVGSMTAAVDAALKGAEKEIPATLVDGPGGESYPITGLTYLLLPKNARSAAQTRALYDFVRWALGPGQKMAEPLLYAPLPPSLIERNMRALSPLAASGRP